ncbi:MAG: protein TolQ [Holosporales bacterium]|jgi:biopolymer transport protein TolQ|nr:protein TolQ [Holosporales bacterium]
MITASTATETVKMVQDVTASHGVSAFSLFLQATLTVKLVMILLIVASCWSWALIFYKVILIKKLSVRTRSFKQAFCSRKSLDEIYMMFSKDKDSFSTLFCSMFQEHSQLARSSLKHDQNAFFDVCKERLERAAEICITRTQACLEDKLSFLASIGSVSPFIGLFGTVWGIMNSFEAIGLEKNASLASVGPGIAEALLATALGLAVAIPAVFAYNKISSSIASYLGDLQIFADEFILILLKKLDGSGE